MTTEFETLLGLTLTEIDKDDYRIQFVTDTGRVFVQDHSQDCCEHVRIEEVHGDLDDLIGSPITMAEVVTYDNEPDPYGKTGSDEDYCWTFYKLATVKGYVTIRWLGESNGFYSTAVDFYEVPVRTLPKPAKG